MARYKKQIKVTIKPAETIRYRNMGDYFIDKEGARCFEIGDTSFDASNLLILLHEFVEYLLIEQAGIPIEEIDEYDKVSVDDEPGDNPEAPYHKQHTVATQIERIICESMGLDWGEHERRINEAWEAARAKNNDKLTKDI